MLAALVPGVVRAGEANALLWRVERDGVRASYLFGTIHLSLPDIVDISPAVRGALLEADTLIGESTPQAAFQVAYVVEMARASPNERAAAALEADLLERVVAAAACQGLTAEQVREEPVWRLVPRLVLMAANTAKAENEQRAQGALPLDAELARLAVAAGKLTAWIESPRQQIDLFRGMAQDDLIGMLREVARRPDCPRDDAGDRILELYRARDLDGMTALEGEWLAAVEDPALWRRFARRLGADRNHRMADRIEEFAQATSVFVAVGAGHLPGSEGLIALLQARGWTVTPIE